MFTPTETHQGHNAVVRLLPVLASVEWIDSLSFYPSGLLMD